MFIETKLQQVTDAITKWEHQMFNQEMGLHCLSREIEEKKPKGDKLKEARGQEIEFTKNIGICKMKIGHLEEMKAKLQEEYENDEEAQKRTEVLRGE